MEFDELSFKLELADLLEKFGVDYIYYHQSLDCYNVLTDEGNIFLSKTLETEKLRK